MSQPEYENPLSSETAHRYLENITQQLDQQISECGTYARTDRYYNTLQIEAHLALGDIDWVEQHTQTLHPNDVIGVIPASIFGTALPTSTKIAALAIAERYIPNAIVPDISNPQHDRFQNSVYDISAIAQAYIDLDMFENAEHIIQTYIVTHPTADLATTNLLSLRNSIIHKHTQEGRLVQAYQAVDKLVDDIDSRLGPLEPDVAQSAEENDTEFLERMNTMLSEETEENIPVLQSEERDRKVRVYCEVIEHLVNIALASHAHPSQDTAISPSIILDRAYRYTEAIEDPSLIRTTEPYEGVAKALVAQAYVQTGVKTFEQVRQDLLDALTIASAGTSIQNLLAKAHILDNDSEHKFVWPVFERVVSICAHMGLDFQPIIDRIDDFQDIEAQQRIDIYAVLGEAFHLTNKPTLADRALQKATLMIESRYGAGETANIWNTVTALLRAGRHNTIQDIIYMATIDTVDYERRAAYEGIITKYNEYATELVNNRASEAAVNAVLAAMVKCGQVYDEQSAKPYVFHQAILNVIDIQLLVNKFAEARILLSQAQSEILDETYESNDSNNRLKDSNVKRVALLNAQLGNIDAALAIANNPKLLYSPDSSIVILSKLIRYLTYLVYNNTY